MINRDRGKRRAEVAFGAIAALAIAIASPVLAAPQYVSSVIDYPKDFAERDVFEDGGLSVTVADVNGDGRRDILWRGWSEANGREILVFEQKEDGQFRNQPDQRIGIKKEVVAHTVADVRATPGDELIFLTESSVYSYSTQIQGYSGNIKKLFDWPLIKSTPNEKRTYGLGPMKDLNGDGKADFLLPTDGYYGVFLAADSESYRYLGKVPEAYVDNSKTGSQYISAFQFLVSERPYPDISTLSKKQKQRIGQYQSGILNKGNWISAVLSANMNGDGLSDFIYLDDPVPDDVKNDEQSKIDNPENQPNHKQLNIALSPKSGQLASVPTKEIPLILNRNTEFMGVMDLNNDKLDDIYVKSTQGSANKTLSFFLNKGGEFDFKNADQVVKVTGMVMEEKFADLNGDGFPELCITTFNMGGGLTTLATGDIKDIAIDRNTLIYKNRYAEVEPGVEPGVESSRKIYGRNADSKMENRIAANTIVNAASFETIISTFTPPHFVGDINSDGIKDVALIDQNGSFSLQAINKSLNIELDSVWKFVPKNAIYGIDLHELNADGLTDFVLNHEKSITVLVSK